MVQIATRRFDALRTEKQERERERYNTSEKERDFRVERDEREKDETVSSASGMAENQGGAS